jgi:hypothetical protein
MYVQLDENNTFLRQVRPLKNIEWDSTHFCPPEKLTSDESAYFCIHPLTRTTRPIYDPSTDALREVNPVLVGGAWTQQWEICPLSAEEIEAMRKATVPTSVSPRQIRQALTRVGLRVSVETAVAAGDKDLKDWWEFATEFQRNNQHVVDMGAALGVSELQLDELFTLSGSL